MPSFVFTALVHLGLGWNGLGAVSNILGFGAGQAGGGGSTALSAKLGKACFLCMIVNLLLMHAAT